MTPAQLAGLDDSHLEKESRLHPEAATAFRAMCDAARRDNIHIDLASGYRNFHRQCAIWNGKFNGERPLLDAHSHPIDALSLEIGERVHAILRWSALPGASRHHWGTDIDVYSKALLPTDTKLQLEPWEYQKGGHQYPLSQWLANYAHQFGFFFPYRIDLGGVGIEPWHLSYAPISKKCLSQLTPTFLKNLLATENIAGKDWLINHLNDVYQRYICNISE
ncbi:M15 family metallopeptidase [Thaumasiovibrio subtropicus]|uniref:M15 family metallopeptidase n=2 Tax=Thaumasiovibrio subtropicus TaxID=1891207 RepID=UPI001C858B1C|nr:M15 family metallopeptidase [Thaumasiovibrio subtropicus]